MSLISVFSGATDSHSLSLKINATGDHWEALWERCGRGNRLDLNNVPWNECSREEQSSILVHFHEHDHLVVLLSSPLGLLLWRCDQVLKIGASWFLSKVALAGLQNIRPPMTKWYKENGGREHFRQAIERGKLPSEMSVPHGELVVVMSTLDKMDSVCEELDTIHKLKDIIFGSDIDSELTIGEFLQIVNRANDYLSIRSDLPKAIPWSTALDHSSKLFDGSLFKHINARHILEAIARIREFDMLRIMGAGKAEMAEWHDKAIFDVYKPVYEGLRRIGLESIPARNLCSAALDGSIDPACVDRSQKSVSLEDTLPWLRLNRLAEAYQKSGMKQSELMNVKGVKRVSRIATLRESLHSPYSAALQNGLIGSKANWTPVRSGTAQVSSKLRPILSYSELPLEETLAAFRERFAYEEFTRRTGLLLKPSLIPSIRYQDGFHFRSLPERDGLFRQIMQLWSRMVGEQFISGLIYGRPVEHPESISESVWNGYKKYFKKDGLIPKQEDRKYVLLCFSKDFLEAYALGSVGINSLIFYS